MQLTALYFMTIMKSTFWIFSQYLLHSNSTDKYKSHIISTKEADNISIKHQ